MMVSRAAQNDSFPVLDAAGAVWSCIRRAVYPLMGRARDWSMLRHTPLVGSAGLRPCVSDRIVDVMPGGVVVLDRSWRIVAVNISARQLQDAQLVQDIASILAEHGLAPASLTLEITESVAMQNTEATIARLQALKALGVRIAIDDFGTGYSSLSYLQRFPIDILKIDRAFVKGIAENADDEALARTIVQLARTLRLQTVAEGIETFEQLERLRVLDCDFGQGYYFARPMLREQIAEILAGSSHLAACNVA